MEHKNPLLHETVSQKFITFGEIMLRLTPPNYEKIRVATSFEASYGGSEANVALALANLGIDSTFFTVVPNNSLGKSAVRMLRSNDVHCSPVILSTPEETPTHRLGTYYLETGSGSGRVKSPTTESTALSQSMTSARWTWTGCCKNSAGCISAESRPRFHRTVPVSFWTA